MRTIVETDATTVRWKQYPNRNKKRLILALIISIVLICSILVLIVYFSKQNESDSKLAQHENHKVLEKSIHSAADNTYVFSDGGFDLLLKPATKTHSIVNDAQKRPFEICFDTTWLKTAITVAGGNGIGSALNQLAYPQDMFVDTQNAIYIADSLNHRIVKWKEGDHQGHVVAGGNGKGNQANQLNYPTAVFVDRLENIYVADNENNRIQKWPMNGKNGETIIGQFGRGDRLDQFDNCWGLYVDKEYNVYVSELSNNRVTKWSPGAQSGQIVVEIRAPLDIHVHETTGDIYVTSYAENSIKQFAADGSLIRQVEKNLVKAPFGLITIANISSENAYISVADSEPHRILQISMDDLYNMTIIACTSYLAENEQNQFNKPKKVQFDSRGNLLVLDSNNHRVQNFSVEIKSCDVIYPTFDRSPYYTRSPHFRTLPDMDIIQKWYDQNISDEANRSKEKGSPTGKNFFSQPHMNIIQQLHDKKTANKVNPSKEKGSPIGENFFPQPPFREFSRRPVDTDVDQTRKDFSFDIPKVSYSQDGSSRHGSPGSGSSRGGSFGGGSSRGGSFGGGSSGGDSIGGGSSRVDSFGSGSSRGDSFGGGSSRVDSFGSGSSRHGSLGSGSSRVGYFGSGSSRGDSFGSGSSRIDTFGSGSSRGGSLGGDSSRIDSFGSGSSKGGSLGGGSSRVDSFRSGSSKHGSLGGGSSRVDSFGSGSSRVASSRGVFFGIRG